MGPEKERDAVGAVDSFAGILRFGGYFAGANGFNRGDQSRQHRGLREGHIVFAQDELELRSQRGEALYRSDVVIEIGLRTIEPDGRGIVGVAGEEQAVGAVEQTDGIRSVAGVERTSRVRPPRSMRSWS